MSIKQQERSALARTQKLNEVIRALNPLLNIRVQYLDAGEISQVIYADNNVVIQLPRDREGNDSDGHGGGGLPPGFEEETLDVVEDDNTPGTRIFLTKEP